MSCAALSATSSTLAGSTTSLTMPASLAAAAVSGRPMASSAKARASPMRSGASRLDPASGMRPSRENGVAKVALRRRRVVAMQQHGGADADREPANRGDERLRVARQRVQELDGLRAQSAALRGSRNFGDVSAGTERAGRVAGEHDGADGVAGRRFAQRPRQ